MISDDLADLLDRASGGDRSAFADFYDQTVTKALRLALLRLRNEQLAEEAIVSAYGEAWRADHFRHSGLSPLAWILVRVQQVANGLKADDRLA